MKTVMGHSCKKHLPGILLLLSSLSASSQMNYAFTAVYGTYASTTAGSVIMPAGTDEALSPALNIGFSFTYNCNSYTQFKVSSNGWMSLGTAATGPLPLNALTTVGQGPLLAPLWDDLAVSAVTPGNVNYELSGVAPNRVLTVEWLYMHWNAAAPGPVMSFEVKLYETTNEIEFVYQREANTIWYGSASIGISSGISATDLYSISGSSGAPVVTYGIESDTVRTRPRGGRIFRWTPMKICPAPGGVPGAAFWVTSTAGTSTTVNGNMLSGWNDQSGNIRDAISPAAANSPVYYDNGIENINFNPVVHFNDASQNPAAASYMDVPVNGILAAGDNPYTVYAVVKPGPDNLTTNGKFLFAGTAGPNNANAFDARSGNAFADTWDMNDLTAGSNWIVNYPALASFDYNTIQRQLFVSGASAGILAGGGRSSADVNSALGCRRATTTEFYDGDIAEIITYPNTSHTIALRQRVESYLGIKYGVTLQHNYLSSAGGTVWDRSQDPAYNNNITGIARDDSSGLLQKESHSSSDQPDLLTVYIGPSKTVNQANNTGAFSSGDRSFFIAANNNDPFLYPWGAPVTEVPPGICCRLRREWLSQQTNFTNADLTLEFDFNVVTPGYSPLNTADLRLLVDADGDFTNATILGSPSISISVMASVVTVVVPASFLTAMPYFTLASVSLSTALPVKTGDFAAGCRNNTVQLGWTKLSGGPNSYTIERSADGGHFRTLGTIQADAPAPKAFTWTDVQPLPGTAWYRLKSTDQQSIVSYSGMISVSACAAGRMRLETDPASGRSVLFLQVQQSTAVDIQLFDAPGRHMYIPGTTGHRTMSPGVWRIPVSAPATGIYFLSVGINGNNSVFRLVQRWYP